MKYLRFSPSGLNTFLSCPELYNLSYNHRRTPLYRKGVLSEGSLAHIILENHYKNKMKDVPLAENMELSILEGRKAASSTDHGQAPMDVESIDLIVDTYKQYAFHYKDEYLVPKAVEVPYCIPLFIDERAGITILNEGKIDLLASNRNEELVIYDHKRVGQKRDRYTATTQDLAYITALSFITGKSYNNIVMNEFGVQTSIPPEKKFRRIVHSYTDDQIKEWREEIAGYWVPKIIELSTQERKHWPHNWTSCDKMGGCPMRRICGSAYEPNRTDMPNSRDTNMEWYYKVTEATVLFPDEED